MANRQHLNYDSDELAHNLKQSTGQGVDALFSPQSPTQPVAGEEQPGRGEQETSLHAPMHARTRVHQQANSHTPIEQELRDQVLIKKHLSSFTFRFRPEELEALDRITDDVNRNGRYKTSKNDVIRLALNWLLRDHQDKNENSMLVKVLTRT
jgi:hypothetical protein